MSKTNFFRSRAFKCGALSGGVVLAGGAAASTALAFKIASSCSAAAAGLINDVGTGFTIAELDAMVHYEQYNLSIVLDNIYADLPENWLQVLQQTKGLPPYCFTISLIAGLMMSILAALLVALIVAFLMFICGQGPASLSLEQLQVRDDAISDDEEQGLFTPS